MKQEFKFLRAILITLRQYFCTWLLEDSFLVK